MESQVAEIEGEFKCGLEKVSWLPGFYAIPPEIQIAGSKAYQQGKVRRDLVMRFSCIDDLFTTGCNLRRELEFPVANLP
jgi:hypothetical protein